MIVNKVATVGTLTANAASQTLLAENDRRRYAIICNSGANGVWLGFGAEAVSGSGVYVPPNGGSFVMDGDNLWRGSVTAIAPGGNSVVGTLELK